MPKHSYEIEIKSLLGGKGNADRLVKKMKAGDANLQALGSHKQLNHYFIGNDLKKLLDKIKGKVKTDKLEELKRLAEHIKNFSVRSRWADGKVTLVIKVSTDKDSSFNGTARLECESLFSGALEELDKLVLGSGFTYQAKWSRERQEFKYKNLNVTIDKNAGYGYLAEFEKVIDDERQTAEAKTEIYKHMKKLGLEELPQDRLERMFDFYNQRWPDYYGTDKIFLIE